MASDLEKFQKNIIGSNGLVTDYTPTIASSGDFSRVYNLNAIISSWNNILITQTRTYMANPDYGSDLYKYIFEPADQRTVNGIKNEIQNRLMKYDDRASITGIEVTFLNDGKGFKIDIDVSFENENASMTTYIHQDNILNFES